MPDLAATEPLLVMNRVTKLFEARRLSSISSPTRKPAVADASLHIMPGETLGLVGESGSGKSTLGRIALNLLTPSAGSVRFQGIDHRDRAGRERRALCRQMQMIFQDTRGALDPRWSVGAQLREPLDIHRIGTPEERRARVIGMTQRVGLDLALLRRRPGALSGGQRQRIVIARAMMLEPALVVCDEPVSALDLSIQASIVALLEEMQSETNTAFLFISHDLRVVRRLARRIAVMRQGRILETGPTQAIYDRPQHPYTQDLLAAAGLRAPERRSGQISRAVSAA